MVEQYVKVRQTFYKNGHFEKGTFCALRDFFGQQTPAPSAQF